METQLVQSIAAEACPEFQKIVYRMVEIIDKSGMELSCAVKWGQLTYAVNDDFHHWIAGIKVTKKFVGLVFHFGGLLEDPNHVFVTGNSKFSRKIEYRLIEDVDKDVILDFLGQAFNKLTYFKEHWREIQAGG